MGFLQDQIIKLGKIATGMTQVESRGTDSFTRAGQRMRVSVVANEVLSLVHVMWLATLLRRMRFYSMR